MQKEINNTPETGAGSVRPSKLRALPGLALAAGLAVGLTTAQAQTTFTETFDFATNADFENAWDVSATDTSFDATGGSLNLTTPSNTGNELFTAVYKQTAFRLDASNSIEFGFTQVDSTENGSIPKVFVQDVNDPTNNIGIRLDHDNSGGDESRVVEFNSLNSILGNSLRFKGLSNESNGVWTLNIPTSGNAVWNFNSAVSSSDNFNTGVGLPTGFRSQFPDGVYIGIAEVGNGFDESIYDDVTITGTAIPEPSTYALLGGILALGAAMLRRRR